MNPFKSKPVHTLDDWLQIATDKLAVSAKGRICTDIEAHYADAFESHVVRGATKETAAARALSELGDPITAARCFRKRHLTQAESNNINATIRRAGHPAFTFPPWLASGAVLLFSLVLFKTSFWLCSVLAILSAICFTVIPIASVAARQENLRSRTVLLIMTQLTEQISYLVFMGIPFTCGLWMFALLLSAMAYGHLPLWLKLWRYNGCIEKAPHSQPQATA